MSSEPLAISDLPSAAGVELQHLPPSPPVRHDSLSVILFFFIIVLFSGTVCGVYLAQNYQVPNIMKLADTAMVMAKHIEEKYRKPANKRDDDGKNNA
ncbi:uncharacterized protein G2W53_011193 [Senna tora]|uniref:Uncharacterized protein n=1 Tax=Senna tora TaxID=362788 RepID=A0A834X1J1_9FABA|nr:uncharacterized protein G2W53_011193 [Senna tora]